MKVQCLCENKFEVTPVTHIDLDADPSFIDKIKSGSFNSFRCPKCGSAVRPDVAMHISWKQKGVKLVCIPEKKRYLCLAFSKNEKLASKSGETCLFEKDESPVIGMWELLDRLNCINAELDPTVLEALKFVVLDGAKNDKSKLEIAFKGVSENKLEFFVDGMGEKIGIIGVPSSLYENMAQDYRKSKKKDIFAAVVVGPYISYKNVFVEN